MNLNYSKCIYFEFFFIFFSFLCIWILPYSFLYFFFSVYVHATVIFFKIKSDHSISQNGHFDLMR